MHHAKLLLCALVLSVASGCPKPVTTAGNTGPTGPTDTDKTRPSDPVQTAAPVAPKTPPAPPKQVAEVEGITEYALDNGMRVLLFPDDSQAKVTVNITYFVGSRHEGYGEAGMAHLLEHMVFKGTPDHADIWKLLQEHGAAFNGTTWVDRTNYYETLPASDENLDFALGLEADRMINSTISAEDLATEFSVVRNEFEAGENSPRAVLEERMHSAAFLWHNYGKSTIGNKSDIERVPVDNLRAFYRKFYQPDNAMLVVAGRFDPKRALELIGKYFASIPRPERKLSPTYTTEPVQDGERVVTLRRVGDIGIVGVLYHGVPGSHADWVATDALTEILTDEPAGRLYKELVEKGMATRVWSNAYSWAEPGTIQFFAEVPSGKPLEPVRDKMLTIIEGLATATGKNAIADAEVSRYRVRQAKNIKLAMANSQRIAIGLTEAAALGDWRMLFINRDRVAALQTAHVRKVAERHFRRDNRTVGMFIPTEKPKRTPLPEIPDVVAMTKGYTGKAAMSKGEVFEASIANIESRTTRKTLKNGMKLALLSKETRGDAVKIRFTIRFGAERDLTGKVTAASLIAPMLLRGSKKRSYQQVRDELDRLEARVGFGRGGFSSAGTGAATTTITTTRANLPAVIALVAELMREPAFAKKEFEIVRTERIAALEKSGNEPVPRGFNRLFRALNKYPKNDVRYLPTTAESLARIKKVKVAQVRNIHKRFWGAQNAEVAVVGDFDAAEVEGALEQHFGKWKAKKPYKRIASPYQQNNAGGDVIETPDKKNAMVGMGHTINVRDDSPDYPALQMITYILGGSAGSRLLERLRQKEGLSYGTFGVVIVGPQDPDSVLFAFAICAPKNAEKAQKFMLEEIRLLVEKGVTQAELDKAKVGYAEQHKSRLANDDFLIGALGSGLQIDRTMAFNQGVNDAIAKLTVADIQRVLDKYIKPDRLFQVRSGDFASIKK